jgi:hypothetical protein
MLTTHPVVGATIALERNSKNELGNTSGVYLEGRDCLNVQVSTIAEERQFR